MKKYCWPITLVAILAGLAFVSWQYHGAAKIRDEATSARRHRAALVGRLKAAQKALDETNAEARKLQAALNRNKAQETVETDLELQKRHQAFARVTRAWMNLHRAALFRKLGLSAEQIDKSEGHFIDLLQNMDDIKTAARANNTPLSDPAVLTMMRDANQTFWQDETALLGPEGVQAEAQYERMAQVHALANTVAGDVYYTDTPLTAEQGEKLTQILANNSANYQNGRIASIQDLSVQNALAQAQEILTPNQLAALKSSLQGMAASSLLYSRIALLTAGAPTGAANPAK